MKDLVSKSLIAFVLKMIGAGLAFGFNILMARYLGAEAMGVYFIAFMLMVLFSIFGRLGLDNVLLRNIAAHSSKGNWVSVKGDYRKGMQVSMVASMASSVVLWLIAPFLATDVFKNSELTSPIQWMALAVVPFALLTLNAESLKGLQRIVFSQFVQGVSISLFAIVFLGLGFSFLSSNIAIDSYIVAIWITFLIAVSLWRKSVKNVPMNLQRDEVSFSCYGSFSLFLIGLVTFMNVFIPTFMLGIYTDSSEVGVFNAAMRTAMLISFILIAVNSVVAPKFAALHRCGNKQALEALAIRSSLLMSFFALPILVVYLAFSERVMFFFGSDFIVGHQVLMILSVGQFVNVLMGSVGYLLIMTGHEKLLKNNLIFGALLGIMLNYMLVPEYGMSGAAVATSSSVILVNIVSLFLVRKKLGFWTLPFIKRKKL